MVPSGPPPLIWRVREPCSSLSMSPMREAPSRVRPRAAAPMGRSLWMFRARSTMSRPVMAAAFTKPLPVMALTISLVMNYGSFLAVKKMRCSPGLGGRSFSSP